MVDSGIQLVNISQGFSSKAGVRVTFRTKDEIVAAAAPAATDLGEHDHKVLELIRANPGTNVRALRGLASDAERRHR